MATRIRLQRRGKKNQPFYHLVIADGRAPRDGRYIEEIGTYNPLTNPATVNLNFDRALYWVEKGADPSDTARSILKHEGVYLMKHLRGGIAKGALTEMDAERKFEAWKQEKESKINNIKREDADKSRNEMKKRLEAEAKVREAISAKVAAKYAAAAEAEAAAAAENAEEAAAEATAEETAEATETPAE
ncbi:MAG: 30S ribosomal protein S16 [Bacteroidales bacterium]|nr:30S ribosomal protein S16 [Bacteroidales bacterium]